MVNLLMEIQGLRATWSASGPCCLVSWPVEWAVQTVGRQDTAAQVPEVHSNPPGLRVVPALTPTHAPPWSEACPVIC
jgi:hypothetical protein